MTFIHVDLAIEWLKKIIAQRVFEMVIYLRGGGPHWVARLIRNVEIMGSSPSKGLRCFLEQETLPLMLSTGWFQERIRA